MSNCLIFYNSCAICGELFMALVPIEASDPNCVCWNCHLKQDEETASSSGDFSMESSAAGPSSPEPKLESLHRTRKLNALLKKHRSKGAKVRFLSDTEKNALISKSLCSAVGEFSRTVTRLEVRRGPEETHHVCPDCTAAARANAPSDVDVEPQMSRLQIRPKDEEEIEPEDNVFLKHPNLMVPLLIALREEKTPMGNIDRKKCAHEGATVRCRACGNAYDATTDMDSIFGCMDCYREKILSTR